MLTSSVYHCDCLPSFVCTALVFTAVTVYPWLSVNRSGYYHSHCLFSVLCTDLVFTAVVFRSSTLLSLLPISRSDPEMTTGHDTLVAVWPKCGGGGGGV